MNISKIEKMFVTASNLQEKADKFVQEVYNEFGVDYYDDIEDEFARELCEKMSVMVGGIEEFREFVINNNVY